jgi:hypothetical protein
MTSKEYLEWRLVSPNHPTPYALMIVRPDDSVSWAVLHAERPLEVRSAHETSDVWRLSRESKLEFALRGLYWDQVDYLTLNKLGGMNNHWMRAAREALGMDIDDIRPSPEEPTELCPNCGKDEVGTFTADDWFLYGSNQYRLVAENVLFFRCMACGLEYTGEDGENKRMEAVRAHLARSAKDQAQRATVSESDG